jgi:phage tail-like protein
MADSGSAQTGAVWPLPRFRFEVKWNAAVMLFQEVSGLDINTQPIAYRQGDSRQSSVIRMPAIKTFGDVTLKKGVCKSDIKFWDWFNDIKTNTLQRKPVTISLLDEAGAPTMVWTLANAWPSKVSGTDMKSSGIEVDVETIVLCHEGLTIANA